MKYIKILYWIVWIVLIVQLVNVVGSIYIYNTDFGQNLVDASSETVFGVYTGLIVMLSVVILVIGLTYLVKALDGIIKIGSFNKSSGIALRYASVFFLISGFLELFFIL